MIARIMAFVAAVAMVGGALAYRASKDDVDVSTSGRGPGRVLCSPEFGELACDDMLHPGLRTHASGGVEIGSGGLADGLIKDGIAPGDPVGGWATVGPWTAIVDDARALASKPKLFKRAETLATTRLVAIVKKGQMPATCSAEVTWKCLGDAAQDRGFRIGALPPDASQGLFVRAALLGGMLGITDYAINDLEENPDAAQWFANANDRLREASGFGATSVNAFLIQSGSATVFLTTEADALEASRRGDVEVVIPKPVATVAAQYASSIKSPLSIDRGAAAEALRTAGWKVGRISGDDGLPSPGVLLALRRRL